MIDLLEKLDKATDRAAGMAISRGFPILVGKKSTLISNLLVEKNYHSFYDVKTLEGKTLYEDISVFDVAVIIAQRHSVGEMAAVKQVLYLETRFSKHYTDMIHYLHCMKAAKAHRDIERLAILEDKFQVSDTLARNTRDKITNFKRVK